MTDREPPRLTLLDHCASAGLFVFLVASAGNAFFPEPRSLWTVSFLVAAFLSALYVQFSRGSPGDKPGDLLLARLVPLIVMVASTAALWRI